MSTGVDHPSPRRMNLAGFTGRGYDKGRGKLAQLAWMVAQSLLVRPWWVSNVFRVRVLRLFGASIGSGVLIRHRVRIHWPWKLVIGDHSWIGEGAWILNLEPVTIGADVCVSQDVLICTGSHDRMSPTFEFDNAAVKIGDRSWLGARCTVLRGVEIGSDATIGATALVTRNVPDNSLLLAPQAQTMNTDSESRR